MEELIVCILLYILVVAVSFSGKRKEQPRRPAKNKTTNARVSSVMDISCIFNEDGEVTPAVRQNKRVRPSVVLSSLTVKELRSLAKEQNVAQVYKLSKAELVSLLRAA
jgi:hypothetical protein